jgi:hypothetical protein
MRPLTAQAALDRHFLEARCKIIEIAAMFDRIDRGEGASEAVLDPRMARIRQAVELLLEDRPGRAERCQRAFSLDFDEGWRAPNGESKTEN